ncbi:UTRA domain-containing protein [Ktedonobacter robiniae]|uniref:UbiC transcription regulator-associated domain-containing protein n=1 Tax=Ktedonobacter robiniae TaxID=2778365 RepID=A0ABQ3V1Z6_9CHLR|nr:UTRA domain-containing protein [Ktedonobacter robiniae]GHO59171.1 hypothetical protein KSB_76460 [Ktedonobacter robiniae]
MHESTLEELIQTPPPELRMGSKTTQAYLEIRKHILSGTYQAQQLLVPKQIEETYRINNTTTQMLLMRLANEGLVKILPVRERTWPNNASLNEYRVADLSQTYQISLPRQSALHSDRPASEHTTDKEILLLKIQYADQEIADLLALNVGEKVILYRERKRRPDKTVISISDTYLPFWFADVLPEIERPEANVYQLIAQLGKHPTSCTESVQVRQAQSIERILFERSPDDPSPLLKLQRRIFDAKDSPLAVQFLTLESEGYQLTYSFPLREQDIS